MAKKLLPSAAAMASVAILFSLVQLQLRVDVGLPSGEALNFSDAKGPESLAFDADGRGPYVSVDDGRIMRWDGREEGWSEFATTRPRRKECEGPTGQDEEHVCGRPLGLRFEEKTGNLYIADAYLGLMMVGPEGGPATQLVTAADGLSFNFTNHLDVDDKNGVVYFSDSSTNYPRRKFLSATISSDRTGRVMKYDSRTQKTTVLINDMAMPNGVALSKDGSFLLIAETSTCRIIKFWLKTHKAGTSEVVMHLPGFPDNMRRTPSGDFWVAIFSKRRMLVKWLLSFPLLGRAFLAVCPFNVESLYWPIAKWLGSNSLALKISGEGKILEVLQDKGGKALRFVTEVEERNGRLYFGSLVMPYVYVL